MPDPLTIILVGLSIAATAAAILLAPKPKFENAKPSQLGDFRFPKTEEGTPVTLFWGRVRLEAPNVLWYGDLATVPIQQKVKSGLFSSKKITVGFNYFLGLHLGIALPTNANARFRRIWFGEKVAWQGDVSGQPAVIQIDEPALFGGPQNGGGVSGEVALYNGAFTQPIDTYLQGVVPDGTILPAYRGLAHAVFRQFGIGEAPNVERVSFECETIPVPLGQGAVGSEGDANPAEVLYDILVTEWGRLGLAGAPDDAAFTAAAVTLAAEGHGLSLQVQNANDARDVIGEILAEIDGLLYEVPDTRKVRLKLIRDDYTVGNLPLFDEDDILEIVSFATTQWAETVNQVRVTYTDRASGYKPKTAFAQDMSNVEFQGGVRSREFKYPGIASAELANRVAARELQLLSIPLITLRIVTTRRGATLLPGDVIRVAWADYGISQIVCRVQKVDLGELDDGRVAIDLAQDRFAVSNTIYADPPGTAFVRPVTAASPVAVRRVFEVPRFLSEALVDAGVSMGAADNSHLLFLAQAPSALEVDFDAEVSSDGGATYGVDAEDASFSATALVDTAYPISTAEYDTSTGLILKSVSDPSVLGSATRAQIEAGANLILIGDELLAYESFVDHMDGTYTLQNVWRGVLDTSPRAHAADERVWFLSSEDLSAFGESFFAGTESLKARLLTDTGLGTLPEGDAPVDDVALQERSLCPYPPDQLTVDGSAHPASATSPVDLVWVRRDRLKAIVSRPDDADEPPEANTTYVARYRVDGGSWTEEVMGNVTSHSLTIAGSGTVDLEVFARRTDVSKDSLFPVQRTFTI